MLQRENAMLRLIRFFSVVILVLLPGFAAAQSASAVPKAPLVLDGKGQIIRNTLIVIQGSKIVTHSYLARGSKATAAVK